MFGLESSPYQLTAEAEAALQADLGRLDARCALLRGDGRLSRATLDRYYRDRRFLQVAESNALEGSTLDLGETELAVLQGVTLTGHDPGYIKDAQSLFRAVERVAELAREAGPTVVDTVRQLHALILDGQMGVGLFRRGPVQLRGQRHVPPKTWAEVADGMAAWEDWSKAHHLDAPLARACVLHTWLTHVHPFTDGNGRTARAIGSLELIRGGLPPAIIRRKDRTRYLDALARSDEGGDLSNIFDLYLERALDAVRDMERAAIEAEGYDPARAAYEQAMGRKLVVWKAVLRVLVLEILEVLHERLASMSGSVAVRWYDEAFDLACFIDVCQGRPVSRAWLCAVRVEVAGMRPMELLLWAGYAADAFKNALGTRAVVGPVIQWSEATGSYPPWRALADRSPGAKQLMQQEDGWVFHPVAGKTWQAKSAHHAAQRIGKDIVDLALADDR